MQEFLGQTYYGNTVMNWGLALVIALGAVVVGKIIYWIFGNVFRRMTAKTETKLDDIILDMIEEPIVVAVTVAGIWYGLNRLVLSEAVDRFIGNVTQVLIVLSIAWLITRLLDSFFKQYLAPLAAKTESDLDDQLLPIVSKGTKIVVWALALVVALNNAGYDVGAVLAGLGIGGLALAMAAKDTRPQGSPGVGVHCDAGHHLAMAPTAHRQEVGLQRPTRAGPAAGHLAAPPARRPDGD